MSKQDTHKINQKIPSWLQEIEKFQGQKQPDSPHIIWELCKKSTVEIPILLAGEKKYYLNSQYDPNSEAIKIIENIESSDFLLIIGIEGGFLAENLIHYQEKFKRIVIIEALPNLFFEVSKRLNINTLSNFSGISIHLATTESQLWSLLSSYYLPHIYKKIHVFCKPSIKQLYSDLQNPIEKQCNAIIAAIQNDFVTQSHFGKRWLYNFVNNLKISNEKLPSNISQHDELIIIGAGPSLISELKKIKQLADTGVPIWAVDASLSYCLQNNIPVEAIITIDGQSISYLHYLNGRKPDSKTDKIIFIGDLLSNPVYFRNSKKIYYGRSNHPLLTYYSFFNTSLDAINTEGGNVGQSLMALAIKSGARTIHAFGLDFSYIDEKPYTNPSFYYSEVFTQCDRFNSPDMLIAKLWIDQDYTKLNKNILQTKRFEFYQTEFLKFVKNQPVCIQSYSDTWESINQTTYKNTERVQTAPLALTYSKTSTKKFLDSYYRDLQLLRNEQTNLNFIFETEDHSLKPVFMTLLPLIAWYIAFLLKNEPENTDIWDSAFTMAIEHTVNALQEHFLL